MSSAVPEGAVMPEGIEVDEAAAYFGVVDTSDAVYQMMNEANPAKFPSLYE